MATVLSDRDIKGLIGSVIKDAELSVINPNGIELRLGHRARFISTGRWWLVAFPGLALMSAVLCFNLLGDGLRDILDPRMRT